MESLRRYHLALETSFLADEGSSAHAWFTGLNEKKFLFNDEVLVEGKLSTRILTLNRPQKLNSLNYDMVSELSANLRAFEKQDNIKLVILKGNGKAFCAGGDAAAMVRFMTFGEYLGLTSALIDGGEMSACGLATHFVPSVNLPSLERELCRVNSANAAVIGAIIDVFAQKVPTREESGYRR
ncbi:hypothetical protein Scep_026842 [Stephania cephalantha]|uniref:3-hydroxyisobutyryl-CoA hydrolase n=1 Tax=Stephania cephalantha TaxID=152367 RepID=A0AAP0ERK1_9MAGN